MPFLLFTHIHMSAPDKCHPSTPAPSYAPHNDPDESVHSLPSSAVLLRSHPASALPMSLQEQRSTAYANSLHNQVRSVLLSVHHSFRDFPENNNRHCRLRQCKCTAWARGDFCAGKSHFPEQKSFPCSFCARKSERFQQKLVGVAGRLKTQRVFRFCLWQNCHGSNRRFEARHLAGELAPPSTSLSKRLF